MEDRRSRFAQDADDPRKAENLALTFKLAETSKTNLTKQGYHVELTKDDTQHNIGPKLAAAMKKILAAISEEKGR